MFVQTPDDDGDDNYLPYYTELLPVTTAHTHSIRRACLRSCGCSSSMVLPKPYAYGGLSIAHMTCAVIATIDMACTAFIVSFISQISVHLLPVCFLLPPLAILSPVWAGFNLLYTQPLFWRMHNSMHALSLVSLIVTLLVLMVGLRPGGTQVPVGVGVGVVIPIIWIVTKLAGIYIYGWMLCCCLRAEDEAHIGMTATDYDVTTYPDNISHSISVNHGRQASEEVFSTSMPPHQSYDESPFLHPNSTQIATMLNATIGSHSPRTSSQRSLSVNYSSQEQSTSLLSNSQ